MLVTEHEKQRDTRGEEAKRFKEVRKAFDLSQVITREIEQIAPECYVESLESILQEFL